MDDKMASVYVSLHMYISTYHFMIKRSVICDV